MCEINHADGNEGMMSSDQADQIAVIFTSVRTQLDDAGYQGAAVTMEALAKVQPGFLDVVSVRDANGLGVTISYWESEDAAKAWRDHPDHKMIREKGREIWYAYYTLEVTRVTRRYAWSRDA
jgi:heme-degrading monooxygenase HmoA